MAIFDNLGLEFEPPLIQGTLNIQDRKEIIYDTELIYEIGMGFFKELAGTYG